MTNVTQTAALLLTVTLFVTGCVDSGGDSVPVDPPVAEIFDYTKMMANIADNVIVDAYEKFETDSMILGDTPGVLASLCGAIGTDTEADARLAAQVSWRQAMASWQEIEAMQLGPIGDNGAVLRNRVYSFFSTSPLSTCAVDQSVVLAESADFDIAARSFNSRGLDALEYLLFNENLEHTCPAAILETETWDSRPESERAQARCQYATQVAADVAAASSDLTAAWMPGGQNFRSAFVNPDNVNESLGSLSDALFYVEIEVKDRKLGVPTGLNSDCSQLTCSSALESPYSANGLANIRNNLVGFKRLYTGNNGLGFDDLLIEQGFNDITVRLLDNIDNAIDLIDAAPATLDQQVAQIEAAGSDADCINSAANPDGIQTVSACSVHGLLKRVTDSLRTEFIAVANLTLPDRVQSDND